MSNDKTKIKICGLRGAEAALAASNAGADYLGFVFVEGVRRQLKPADGAQLISEYRSANSTGSSPGLVGLFRNQEITWVNEVVRTVGLDFVQLCGDEDDSYISMMNVPVFRQVRVKEGTTPTQLRKFVSPHLEAERVVVLDRFDKDTPGGSGLSFDWAAAENVANLDNVLLAGGLKPENVQSAIVRLSPWGVDVSSGVETDGVKNPERIRSFITAVRNA